MTESITLTVPDACRRLGISDSLGRQLARQGKFPGAFQLGRVWRVHRATFEAEVERMARGKLLEEHDSDVVLARALDEARFRQQPHRRSG